LHLARPGRFTDLHGQDVEVTPALLAQLAASYDPAVYRAPLVIGHPKTNSPAFGWLGAVQATAAGLFGTPTQLDPAFVAAVRDARYPHRSLSFWPAGHPGSPVPGQPYIRHLGVLGATAPAIPGLLGADLAGAATGVACVDLALPPDAFTSLEPLMDETIDLAARSAALTARETAAAAQAAALAATQADLERRAQALADQERAAARTAVVAFATGLADAARIRPADIQPLAEILVRLEQTAPAVCFAAPDAAAQPAAAATWLRTWLAAQPPLVELAELATTARAGAAAAVDFAAPAGYQVDLLQLALHAKVRAYQAAHPTLTYEAALAAVGG